MMKKLRSTKYDPIELNQKIFMFVSNYCNMIPWKFENHGKAVKSPHRVWSIRWTLWILTFGLSILYAFYINITLLHTFTHGLKTVRYDQLGVHMVRALLSASLTYWAHEFLAHSEDHQLLYNFVQSNPGTTLRFC